jgi:hypothetical protein
MLKKKISEAEFNKTQRIVEVLKNALITTMIEYRNNPKLNSNNDEILRKKPIRKFTKLDLMRNELREMATSNNLPQFIYLDDLTPYEFNPEISDSLIAYLDRMDKIFTQVSNKASDKIDGFLRKNKLLLKKHENNYYNKKLEEIVTKPYESNKYLIYKNSIVQNTDPIYLDPHKSGLLGFRTHFFAPTKYIFGMHADTFVFNISLVLLSTIILYVILYFEFLSNAVKFFENFKLRK